ncbi:hypothetical protein GCM10025868_22900 [Angustibacter aerolatus]|uniref:Uncharacterized protein n=1 Tax=Angustibacter aerolatus TaxID=1162965 RepID=A0ABQ6JJQ3_9ACTN|nr:hypothetical protein GCM10025868_22900 [Angustibacter aerolatus]
MPRAVCALAVASSPAAANTTGTSAPHADGRRGRSRRAPARSRATTVVTPPILRRTTDEE